MAAKIAAAEIAQMEQQMAQMQQQIEHSKQAGQPSPTQQPPHLQITEEDEAEAKCEALACEAVELVQGLQEQLLAEPYQTLASLRLSQERPDEAGPLLDKVLAIIVVRGAGPR